MCVMYGYVKCNVILLKLFKSIVDRDSLYM